MSGSPLLLTIWWEHGCGALLITRTRTRIQIRKAVLIDADPIFGQYGTVGLSCARKKRLVSAVPGKSVGVAVDGHAERRRRARHRFENRAGIRHRGARPCPAVVRDVPVAATFEGHAEGSRRAGHAAEASGGAVDYVDLRPRRPRRPVVGVDAAVHTRRDAERCRRTRHRHGLVGAGPQRMLRGPGRTVERVDPIATDGGTE